MSKAIDAARDDASVQADKADRSSRRAAKAAEKLARKNARLKLRQTGGSQSEPRAWQEDQPPTPEMAFNAVSARVHGASAKMASSLRFSIKLRIAMGHVLLLTGKMFSALLLVAFVAAWMHVPAYRDAFKAALPFIELHSAESLGELPPYVSTQYLEDSPDAPPIDEHSVITVREWSLESHPTFNGYRRPALPDLYLAYTVNRYRILLDITGAATTLSWCAFALCIYWLVASLGTLRSGQRVSARLLAPITDIANTAEQLTEQNLSMRINVAGTHSELRNLAMMVNGMLDRVESAYNRQKQFVSDASHELRTPIAVVQGYADLLARWGKDAPEVRDESITAIQNETRSMKELVESLLYLARHDKGTLKLNPETFSPVELIQETIKETSLITRDHHIEAGSLEECALFADRSAIKQALRIFIDNAVKYTPKDGYISVSCRVSEHSCSITIRDTGIGISKDDLPRIFDRFYRVDPARNQQNSYVSGHGLGLSIARIIVSSHGGKLHVRSKPGQGSAFTIALPM